MRLNGTGHASIQMASNLPYMRAAGVARRSTSATRNAYIESLYCWWWRNSMPLLSHMCVCMHVGQIFVRKVQSVTEKKF